MKIYTVVRTSPFGQQLRVYKTIEEAKEQMEKSILEDFNDYREGHDEVKQVSTIDELKQAMEEGDIERTGTAVEKELWYVKLPVSWSYNFNGDDELYTMELVEHEL